MMRDGCATEHVTWRGITIEIRYARDWLSLDFNPDQVRYAHLEIQAINPPCAPLPITETGYRSHFCNPDEIEKHGGAAAFALLWLEDEARSQAWQVYTAPAQQLKFF